MDKQMRRLLGLFAISVAASFLSSQALSQAWCPKPSGILAREYGYDSTVRLREFAERVAKGKDYLIVSKINPANLQQDIAPSSRLRAMDAFSRSRDFEDTKKDMQEVLRITERNLEKMGSPKSTVKKEAEQAMLRHLFSGKVSTSIDYHYVYASKPKVLEEIAKDAASESGVTIEGAKEESPGLFRTEGVNGHPFKRIVEKMNVGVIILDGIDHPSDFNAIVPEGVPVLKIADSKLALSDNKNAQFALAKSQRAFEKKNVAEISIVNMFPVRPNAAKVWGFDQIKAGKYADAGAAFVRKLEKGGYKSALASRPSKQDFIDGLKEDTLRKSAIYIIGEAKADGAIRIPGSVDTIGRGDLAGIDLSKVYFVSCGSQGLGASAAALSFVGKVYTDHADTILQVFLPSLSKDNPENSIVVHLSDHAMNAVLLDVLAELACQVTSDKGCSIGLFALMSQTPQ